MGLVESFSQSSVHRILTGAHKACADSLNRSNHRGDQVVFVESTTWCLEVSRSSLPQRRELSLISRHSVNLARSFRATDEAWLWKSYQCSCGARVSAQKGFGPSLPHSSSSASLPSLSCDDRRDRLCVVVRCAHVIVLFLRTM